VFGEEMQPDLILCNAAISASNSGHAEQNDLAAWCCMVLHGAAWCCMVLHGAAWCCMVLH